MRLSERLESLETNLAQVLSECQTLKVQVLKLEQENERLRDQLAPHMAAVQHQELPAEAGESDFNDGRDTLMKLYEEGYHVCHLNFGQERDGECLFCLGFLTNAGS